MRVLFGSNHKAPCVAVHADQHGAMTVDKKYFEALPDALRLVTDREKPILNAARKNEFNIEKLKKAFEESKKITWNN